MGWGVPGNGQALAPAQPEPGASYRHARFFSDDSPWNTPIGASDTFVAIPGVDRWPVGFTSWLGDDAASVAIYFADRKDPRRPILYNDKAWSNVESGQWRRWGNPRRVEAEILRTSCPTLPYRLNYYSTPASDGQPSDMPDAPAGSVRLPTTADTSRLHPLYARIPSDAVPSPDSDGHMVVFQLDGQALELYAAIVLSSGEVVAGMYGFTDPSGTGTGREHGRRASLLPSYGGVLRSADLAAGKIDHAMVLLAPPAMLSRSFVEPALAFDSDSSDYGGTLPMGARLAIPPEIGLDDLDLQTRVGAMIAATAKAYGFFIGDRGGPGWTIVTEYRPSDPDLAERNRALNSDLERIFKRLQRVVR
jgi:hypothetical protein